MLRNILLISSILFFSVQSAMAVSISLYNVDSQQGAIDSWLNSIGGVQQVLEDFEDATAGWYRSYDSAIGTFTAGGLAGTGATSYNANNNPDSSDPYLQIKDLGTSSSYYGRVNTTAGGSYFLDSADISELTLDLSASVKNLYFYLSDPSDVKATTTTEAANVSASVDYKQSNGSLWFVGIMADQYIDSVTWTTDHYDSGLDYTNDGFGLDDFGTVAPVPEPATLVLLGAGLVGLAIVRRRK